MKKTNTKKLALRNETLRKLAQDELGVVAGGTVGTTTLYCAPTYPALYCHVKTPSCPI